ncbi:hypothetical protein M8C21_006353 [Ambrosia artemisiifolia]|uniref:Uncharacterized protein n=1 Tax=Ambrosia artemisiifolia TaxID=4212 RepID=A0AAD5CFE5_AMBAR|nr:hypothetical protein M8C21_006353 [Ambrosia artemisiifolia]
MRMMMMMRTVLIMTFSSLLHKNISLRNQTVIFRRPPPAASMAVGQFFNPEEGRKEFSPKSLLLFCFLRRTLQAQMSFTSCRLEPCIWNISHSSITGFIARELFQLASLQELNLQSNGLTGQLPLELCNLKYLQELRLNINKLCGNVLGGNASVVSNTQGM